LWEGILATALTSAVEVVTLQKGAYLFTVTSAQPSIKGLGGSLVLPALQIGRCPGQSAAAIELDSDPALSSAWLLKSDDSVVVRVLEESASLLLTSVGADKTTPLEVEVRRIDQAAPAASSDAHGFGDADIVAPGALRTQITAHVQFKGDLTFLDEPWAGLPGQGLWIEAFEIVPRERLQAEQIEYKALDAAGTETTWVRGGWTCGTRGLGIPLVGFAVRLNPESGVTDCEIEYRARFVSGRVAGPARNGEPLLSPEEGDPIEAIHLSIVPSIDESSPVNPENASQSAAADKPKRRGAAFGVFREQSEVSA